MAVLGRFLYNGAARCGEVEADRVKFVDSIFGDRRATGEEAGLEEVRVLAPVEPGKLFAIGLNYADHAKESNQQVPDVPLMWFKAPTAVIGQGETIEIAYPEHRTDYEGELTIVIGRRCKGVSPAEAANYILGYTIGQDISDRTIQNSEGQWARCKSFDTYAPLGPFIYTAVDPGHLPIETRLNGEVRQSSNTSQMVFTPTRLVAFLSEAITLMPGDCIMTGTPHGIGAMKDGDMLETRIGEMTPLTNKVSVVKKVLS